MTLKKNHPSLIPVPWQEDHTPEGFKSESSSNIHSAHYIPRLKLLIVCFKFETGGIKSVYTYEDFPMKEWIKWLISESKGGHFNQFIRPIFQGKRIDNG